MRVLIQKIELGNVRHSRRLPEARIEMLLH